MIDKACFDGLIQIRVIRLLDVVASKGKANMQRRREREG